MPANVVGSDCQIYSSTAPRSPFAHEKHALPDPGVPYGEISEIPTKFNNNGVCEPGAG